MAKLTEKEKAILLGKLQARRREIENSQIFKEYQKFLKLSDKEKEQRYLAWNKYYKDVRSTTTYALYVEQKKALLERNYIRVKELAKQARRMRDDGIVPELAKPPYTDPWEFSNSSTMKTWEEVNSRIKTLVSEGMDLYEDLGF